MNHLDPSLDGASPLSAPAAGAAGRDARAGRQRVDHTRSHITHAADDFCIEVAPLFGWGTVWPDGLVQRGTDAVRQGGQRLRERAESLSARAVAFVNGAPVKALLIPAAVGTALMGRLAPAGRTRRRS